MTLQERRNREKRHFYLKVGLLLSLMSGIAYAAWFAPWARPLQEIPIERAR
jgi:hypothetical protein